MDEFPFLEPPPNIETHGLMKLVGDDEFTAVDIRLLVSHYVETIVKHGDGTSRAALPEWSVEDPLTPLYTVVFGDYGDNAPAPRYRRAFLGLRAEQVRIEDEVPAELLERVSPIVFTGDQLSRPPQWLGGHGLVLGDPGDADTLAGFWNLRSIGVSVAFWPLPDGGKFNAYCLEHLKQVIPTAQENGEIFGPELWRFEWPEGDREIPTEIKEVLDEVGARPTLGPISDWTWSQPLQRPSVWSARSRTVLGTVEDDTWGRRRMVFALPDHPCVGAQMRDSWLSHWIVSVSALSEYDNPGYTLRLPSLPDLNRWASDVFDPIDHVRLNGGAIGIFKRPRDTRLKFPLAQEIRGGSAGSAAWGPHRRDEFGGRGREPDHPSDGRPLGMPNVPASGRA